jgi:hypothetical protein
METVNSIYLRRKNKVVVTDESKFHSSDNFYMILTILHNVGTLGYTFSESLLNRLSELDCDQLADFYAELIPDLRKMVGAHKEYVPMYPNFPKQVMSAYDAELFVNKRFHYWGSWVGLRIMPAYVKKERKPLKDDVTYKVIDLGSVEDFESIFTNLVSSNTSISQTDKDDIEWFVKVMGNLVQDLIPASLPNKETMAFLSARLLEHVDENLATTLVRSYVKTATDVLRIAVGLSGGDVSLAQPCKFRNFKKKERRFILSLLNGLAEVDSATVNEDMQRWTERWKRLAQKLHAVDFEDRYKSASVSINFICNGIRVETFNSRLELAYKNRNYYEVVKVLSERAGEFARNLDRLIRAIMDTEHTGNHIDVSMVVKAFNKVVGQVSTPVLLQVMAHFKNRGQEKYLRVFLPKGNVAKVYGIENYRPALNMFACGAVVLACEEALKERFSKLPSLGNVYLDERLKGYVVPFSQRSASKALKTVSRGSRIKLEGGKNTVRFFIWWRDADDSYKDSDGSYYSTRVDIDLSALFLDENFKEVGLVSYHSLRNEASVHSGDIVSAPRGACEFIDVNIKKAKEALGAKYVAMCMNSYTNQLYSSLPECFGGFMMREGKGNTGEIFDARTVENKFDITAETQYVMPLIIDLEAEEVIWTDMSLKINGYCANNVVSNLTQSQLMMKAMVEMVKPSLYDLFRLHAEARGTLIEDIDTAKCIFGSEDSFNDYARMQVTVVTPYDMDVIMSEYLS